ncbi:MAG: glycosyltransferase [Pirellulales bacterium]
MYRQARDLGAAGETSRANALYNRLLNLTRDKRLKALVHSDRGVLAAMAGNLLEASALFQAALQLDPGCAQAVENLALLNGATAVNGPSMAKETDRTSAKGGSDGEVPARVAIVSFLFNWPSTGGGIVHTAELARFLGLGGYEVRHFYGRNPARGIGNVEGRLPFDSRAIELADRTWNIPAIQAAYRDAVDAFDPDVVIITDAWNMKPVLAEALGEYPYLLRQQALECLCPLNNLRLLFDGAGRVTQCPKHQLAAPGDCRACLESRGHQSGALHQMERSLAGVGSQSYDERLRRAFAQAEAVLVLNPLVEAMIAPYAQRVRIVTWGMDPVRFPWPWPDEPIAQPNKRVRTLLMAGVIDEVIKGFHVLQEACQKLWNKRRDFELLATGQPCGRFNEFTRFIGWLSQEELPRQIRAADVLVMPTIAQEGLGRTTVEAMGVGRPVIASRIGGLPYTVCDGATGLLFEPGNADDLAAKIETLLDDAALGEQMGLAGRKKFENEFLWPDVIERQYRPLLTRRASEGPH